MIEFDAQKPKSLRGAKACGWLVEVEKGGFDQGWGEPRAQILGLFFWLLFPPGGHTSQLCRQKIQRLRAPIDKVFLPNPLRSQWILLKEEQELLVVVGFETIFELEDTSYL